MHRFSIAIRTAGLGLIRTAGLGLWLWAMAGGAWAEESSPQVRTWTDREGRELRGCLTAIQSGQVTVKLARNGRAVPIRRELLSPADQAYVKEWADLGFGATVARWPQELRPMLNFTARPEDQVEPGQWVYSTPHFRYICDVPLAPSLIKEYSLAFEGTYYAIENLPLNLDPEPPDGKFVVRLFRNRNDYLRAGGPQGSAGVYMIRSREILVPMESLGVRTVGNRVAIDRRRYDAGTLIHEITHQVMHHWLDVLPVWFVEGMAEYMSAVPFDDARFNFRGIHEGIHHQLEGEYQVQKNREGVFALDMVVPPDLMELTHQQWAAAVSAGRGATLNYRSAMLLVYYLIHLDGRGDGSPIIAYLQQARSKQTEMKSFIANYNTAVTDYNDSLKAYNEDVKSYNQRLIDFRESVKAYNERVRTYNAQLEQNIPDDQLIVVEPVPGEPPAPPRKPELPVILAKSSVGATGIVDLAEAEVEARRAIFRKRDAEALWMDMEKGFAARGIQIRPVRYRTGGSAFGSLRAVPIGGNPARSKRSP